MCDSQVMSMLKDVDKQKMFQEIEEMVSQKYIPGFQLQDIQFTVVVGDIYPATTVEPIVDPSLPPTPTPPVDSDADPAADSSTIIFCVVGQDENGNPIFGTCRPDIPPPPPNSGGIG